MLRSVASNGAIRSALSAGCRRNLAIMPTVKKATDTSAEEFPAPSHVNLAAEASSIARQFREFYSNPDSTIKFSEEARAALAAEVLKKAKSVPGSEVTDGWVSGNLKIPETMRLGDNPLFKVHNPDK